MGVMWSGTADRATWCANNAGSRARGREREPDRRPAADRALRPYPAAVALDDAPDDRQADAGAFEVLVGVHAVKRLEQARAVLHVEARAVIADRERLVGLAHHGDLGAISLAGELPGIGEQVLEHDRHQPAVADRRQAFGDLDGDVARRRPGAQI